MTGTDPNQVTRLLDAAGRGDAGAARDLLPIVYDDLRRLAERRMASLPCGQTLQPTALVHEAYLRLVKDTGGAGGQWASRRHFFAAAATAMRDILVDHARQHASRKRGGDRRRVDLDQALSVDEDAASDDVDLVRLDEALSRLTAKDPRNSEIVMLRYFAGLSVEETARAMDLSPATVKREWSFAKALLLDDIRHGAEEP